MLVAPALGAQSAPIIELRDGRWFDGRRFVAGSRWMRAGEFVARPARAADSVVSLGGRWIVPPYGDAHTHSPDGEFGFETIRDMYLRTGVFYVQVLTNTRSGRLALRGRVNVPSSIDAAYADGAVTASGGHPQVIYESLGLFRRPYGSPAERRQASRTRDREGDVYHLLDEATQLPAIMRRVRRDTLPLLKVMLLDSDRRAGIRADSTRVGEYGIDPPLLPALVDSAHAAGRRVWAHVETVRDFELALDAGVDGFAHVPGYGAARIDDADLARYRLTPALARRAARLGVTVVPTMGLADGGVIDDPGAVRRVESVTARNVRLLAGAGVRLLTGSDTYSSAAIIERDAATLGGVLRLSRRERLVLRAVTTPRAIFPGRRLGALRPGHEASFLALACDPLVALACQSRITMRVKQGTMLHVPPVDTTER
jgi:imidazolonepropionase-like amidohydrolase